MRRAAGTRASTTETGARAEQLGQRYLEKQGLRVVAQNFRSRAGELDLVMLEGPQLVVVEIRYRARAELIHPALTVTAAKRRRVLRAATRFLQVRPEFRDRPVRFDVLTLTGPLEAARCEWIRAAFTADDVHG